RKVLDAQAHLRYATKNLTLSKYELINSLLEEINSNIGVLSGIKSNLKDDDDIVKVKYYIDDLNEKYNAVKSDYGKLDVTSTDDDLIDQCLATSEELFKSSLDKKNKAQEDFGSSSNKFFSKVMDKIKSCSSYIKISVISLLVIILLLLLRKYMKSRKHDELG
ncbi:MAG TPA: hypothetical protein O0X14_01785, partial [Methanocorpusculum sp.]|nr:hypothetical protein [Methanocorpusculum sp.]